MTDETGMTLAECEDCRAQTVREFPIFTRFAFVIADWIGARLAEPEWIQPPAASYSVFRGWSDQIVAMRLGWRWVVPAGPEGSFSRVEIVEVIDRMNRRKMVENFRPSALPTFRRA